MYMNGWSRFTTSPAFFPAMESSSESSEISPFSTVSSVSSASHSIRRDGGWSSSAFVNDHDDNGNYYENTGYENYTDYSAFEVDEMMDEIFDFHLIKRMNDEIATLSQKVAGERVDESFTQFCLSAGS